MRDVIPRESRQQSSGVGKWERMSICVLSPTLQATSFSASIRRSATRANVPPLETYAPAAHSPTKIRFRR